MTEQFPAYGLWSLVVLNSAIFIIFAFSFFKPQTKRDWRSFGAFSAFLVALFTEMYGFPLTIYLLSGWLQTRFPDINWFSHDAGHLPEMLFGWQDSPHLGPFHVVSVVLIGAGFILLSAAWRVLYQAQRDTNLAQAGPYAKVRHPQYAGFVLIMLGFLFQWPTLLTLAMFPVLVVMYWRLALREEREVEAEFDEAYRRYAAQVPAFFPKLGLFNQDEVRKFGAVAFIIAFGALANLSFAGVSAASSHGQSKGTSSAGESMMGRGMMGSGMMMPTMDPAAGRKLFASKGCVVCHSVNGIGGEDARPLDASTMESAMNPFEFAAKMWRGAEAMILLQQEELGQQIEFTGQELGDIIAFTHHPEEQKRFTEADIPPRIRELIEHGHEPGTDRHDKEAD